MTKKEIVQYLKQNMPTFTGNKIEKEKKDGYVYIFRTWKNEGI